MPSQQHKLRNFASHLILLTSPTARSPSRRLSYSFLFCDALANNLKSSDLYSCLSFDHPLFLFSASYINVLLCIITSVMMSPKTKSLPDSDVTPVPATCSVTLSFSLHHQHPLLCLHLLFCQNLANIFGSFMKSIEAAEPFCVAGLTGFGFVVHSALLPTSILHLAPLSPRH